MFKINVTRTIVKRFNQTRRNMSGHGHDTEASAGKGQPGIDVRCINNGH